MSSFGFFLVLNRIVQLNSEIVNKTLKKKFCILNGECFFGDFFVNKCEVKEHWQACDDSSKTRKQIKEMQISKHLISAQSQHFQYIVSYSNSYKQNQEYDNKQFLFSFKLLH